MSKYILSFNSKTSKQWNIDPRYNELFLKSTIHYYEEQIKVDRIVFMKEALKSMGFDIKNFDIDTLSKYWLEDIDITFRKQETPENTWLITFKTDN